MAHPNGGKGNVFSTKHSFEEAFSHIGHQYTFSSTTGEQIHARPGSSKGGSATIVFAGENCTHGNVCKSCWGFRNNCSGTHIGQCVEALDRAITLPK